MQIEECLGQALEDWQDRRPSCNVSRIQVLGWGSLEDSSKKRHHPACLLFFQSGSDALQPQPSDGAAGLFVVEGCTENMSSCVGAHSDALGRVNLGD